LARIGLKEHLFITGLSISLTYIEADNYSKHFHLKNPKKSNF